MDYLSLLEELRNAADPHQERIALMLEYQHEFGMRMEESSKFNPLRDDLEKWIHIHRGAKNGRPRWLTLNKEDQRSLLVRAKESGFYRSPKDSLIPEGMSEKQWINKVYKRLAKLGMTKKGIGTPHGLRHGYIHERYEEQTGFPPPAKFGSKEEYERQAEAVAGEHWRDKDDLARCSTREDTGHSPDRTDIDSQYLGRWK